jgi:hypothetical protein
MWWNSGSQLRDRFPSICRVHRTLWRSTRNDSFHGVEVALVGLACGRGTTEQELTDPHAAARLTIGTMAAVGVNGAPIDGAAG